MHVSCMFNFIGNVTKNTFSTGNTKQWMEKIVLRLKFHIVYVFLPKNIEIV